LLKESLLRFIGLRYRSPARSHVHGHLPFRFGLHLVLIAMAAVAALLTARLVSDAELVQVSTIPSSPLSGVRAIAPTGETFLRPGVSHATTESPLRDSLPNHQDSGEKPDEGTLTDGVGEASAEAEGAGCGLRALAEQIDPTEPYVLYVVRPGDTLGHIAEACGSTVNNILLNNAEVDDVSLIPIGLQILVPLIQAPIETGILYKIGHGETLSDIIDDYINVTIDDVLAYRPNSLSDPGDIQPGEYILLPNAEPKPVSPDGWALTPPPPVSPGRFGLPLAAWSLISDTFGTPRGAGRVHTGIDLALGGYPASSVYASCDGSVSRVEHLTYSYGFYVIVDCGGGWETLYSHFREIIVSYGQGVTKGETILGISGSTGFSTGEHLHFEIRYNGQPQNPENYLDFR